MPEKEQDSVSSPNSAKVQQRPKVLPSVTDHVDTGCGEIAVTISFLDDKSFEVFTKLGKQGGCTAATMEALSRCISLGLRAGVSIDEYYEHLKDIKCLQKTYSEGEMIESCPDAMSKVFKKYAKPKQT